MHPDELDFYDDEECANDDLRRLQEMTEIGRVGQEDDEDEEDDERKADVELGVGAGCEDATLLTCHDVLQNIQSWSWELPAAERHAMAAALLQFVAALILKLCKSSDPYIAAARQNRSEAGSHAFRKARLVAATVVGASRRLEAVRAAEPFAVVVEEACEVMEPTIMSVLAVKSLRKLELVGDHRQLPAFIQQCWYNLECALPSMKVSLFERLVTGSVKTRGRSRREDVSPALCTVLDEQRRMRSYISNITKPDYADVIAISDHPHTAVQLIGDSFARTHDRQDRAQAKQCERLMKHRAEWIGEGRDVPGLQTNLYFWNLVGNKESRPIAGLSACNQSEADAVCGLTKYLLDCGVSPSSISIITPYKGQKTLITKVLRSHQCLEPFNPQAPPARGTTITVSTVDRYQGDENDIVILSLVRASPGNRFVALHNRFIVAVSRARLGFFIIGSVDAVIKGASEAASGNQKHLVLPYTRLTGNLSVVFVVFFVMQVQLIGGGLSGSSRQPMQRL